MRLSAAALAVIATFCTLSAASVGQKPAAPVTGQPREAAVPFHANERLTYDVSWSSFMVAGTAVLTVGDKKPSSNSTAYSISAEGRPVPLVARLYTLYYRMDTLVDAYTLLSQRGSLYAEEGDEKHTAVTRFDRTANKAFFEVQGSQ